MKIIHYWNYARDEIIFVNLKRAGANLTIAKVPENDQYLSFKITRIL